MHRSENTGVSARVSQYHLGYSSPGAGMLPLQPDLLTAWAENATKCLDFSKS